MQLIYLIFFCLFKQQFVHVVKLDVISSMDIFGLEDNLPDELVSSGNSWGEPLGGNKPPAQGPGPGNQQINGEDPNLSSAVLQRQFQLQQQQLHNLTQHQQQVKE